MEKLYVTPGEKWIRDFQFVNNITHTRELGLYIFIKIRKTVIIKAFVRFP